MIKLRKLDLKDAPFMLEWMHDEESKLIFQNDFASMTEEKVVNFISNSNDEKNKHFAIVDDKDDEYLGTISLKNIDMKNKNAEYAISTRKKARGIGCNKIATELMIKYGFEELGLHKIYLNVLSTNTRAIKFYKKCGFVYEGTFKDYLLINGEFKNLEWYGIINE